MHRVGMVMMLLVCSGCTLPSMDVSLFASALKPAAVGASAGQRAHAEDCVSYLTLIPVQPRLKPDATRVVDEAIEQAGPQYDALVQADFTRYWVVTVVWNYLCYEVEGTPVNSRELAAQGGDLGGPRVYYHSGRDRP